MTSYGVSKQKWDTQKGMATIITTKGGMADLDGCGLGVFALALGHALKNGTRQKNGT